MKLLCDDYSDVRKEAAIALGILGSKKAIPSLKQSLDDADIEVRIQSQKALEKLNVWVIQMRIIKKMKLDRIK